MKIEATVLEVDCAIAPYGGRFTRTGKLRFGFYPDGAIGIQMVKDDTMDGAFAMLELDRVVGAVIPPDSSQVLADWIVRERGDGEVKSD